MIKITRSEGIFEITLNNPKVNAIGADMSRQMGEALNEFQSDPDMHVAIIYGGEGKIFSAGWDLKAVAEEGLDENEDYGDGGFAGITERFDLTKPVIAAVNGTAVGAGVEIALACDMIVASETAQFFLPETSLGVMADVGGVQRLPRKIPVNFAMEMLFTGRAMTAAEGLHFGLFNYVVSKENVIAKARELASQIVDAAPLAVRAIKEVVAGTLHQHLPEAFHFIKEPGLYPTYAQMLTSEDHEEGPKAFAEKRKPNWKGR